MRRGQFMGWGWREIKGTEGKMLCQWCSMSHPARRAPPIPKWPIRAEYRIGGPLQFSQHVTDCHLTLLKEPPSLWLPSCHQAASKNLLSAHNGRGRLQPGCGNEVPTVASHTMRCLLVMIKVSCGTFLCGYGFFFWSTPGDVRLHNSPGTKAFTYK